MKYLIVILVTVVVTVFACDAFNRYTDVVKSVNDKKVEQQLSKMGL